MRPLLPAVVMLACACGSSNPEPVSTPTPAPDSAERAALRASISAREQYYDIDGSSAGALRNQIRRLGPKDESGKSARSCPHVATRGQLRAARRESHARRLRDPAPLEAAGDRFARAAEDVAGLLEGRPAA